MKRTRIMHRWLNENLEILLPVSILVFGAMLFYDRVQAYLVGMLFAFLAMLLFQFLTARKKRSVRLKEKRGVLWGYLHLLTEASELEQSELR